MNFVKRIFFPPKKGEGSGSYLGQEKDQSQLDNSGDNWNEPGISENQAGFESAVAEITDKRICEGKRQFLVEWIEDEQAYKSWANADEIVSVDMVCDYYEAVLADQMERQENLANESPRKRKRRSGSETEKASQSGDDEEIDEILGAALSNGQLVFLVRWPSQREQLLFAKRVYTKWPLKAIRFFEQRLCWDFEDKGNSQSSP